MTYRPVLVVLIDLAITLSSAIGAIAILPVFLVRLDHWPLGWLIAATAAAAFRIGFLVFTDLALKIETPVIGRTFCGLMALLIVAISVLRWGDASYWLSPVDELILNVFIVALIMARQIASIPPGPPSPRGPASKSKKEVSDALSRYGVRYEFGGTFLYMPLPRRDEDAEMWALIDSIRAYGLIADRSWRIPPDQAPTHLKRGRSEAVAFQIFRVRLEAFETAT